LLRQVVTQARPAELELNWARAGQDTCVRLHLRPELDRDGRVVGVLAMGCDISQLKRTEAGLRQSHELLRALTAHRESRHEKERQRLANQIHEDLAQNLSALRMAIAAFEIDGESPAQLPRLRGMRDIVDSSIARIRD